MDYNINFKYKSGGGTSASGLSTLMSSRQRAIQASQKSGQVIPRPDEASRKMIDVNTKLTTAVLSLRQSVTMLNATMKNQRGFGGGGGGMGITGGRSLDSSAGFGGMGASLPIAGAAIALTGFVIQKVNQIGNAYIEKMSQQARSVGVGGFRRGQGMYNAAEMGAGMQAYGMSSGRFAQGVTPDAAAMQAGNIFGLSSAEVLGQAGIFSRTGANYGQALYTGAGAGMETELPKLMQAMAGVLEEAVKNGVNTSNLSKDLGEDIIAFTMATNTKSVEAAMKVAQSAGASKSKAAIGQMENIEDLFVWRGAQEEMLSSLNNADARNETLKYMEERQYITPEQRKQLQGMKKIGVSDLTRVGGEELVNTLTQDVVTNMSEFQAAKKIQAGYMGMDSSMSINRMEILSQAMGGMGKNLRTTALAGERDYGVAGISGKKKIEEWEQEKVLKTSVAMEVAFSRTKENDLLTYGHSFAQATIEMDTAMRDLAKTGMKAATTGITEMGNAAMKISESFKELSDELDKIKKKGLGKYIKDLLWD